MTDLGLFLTQIQQKNIRVIQAIRGKKISHKSATNYHKQPTNRKHQFNPSKPNLHQF